MNNSADEHPALRERFAAAFSRLPEQDIEQFYAQYQLWLLRRRVPIIQKQLEALDEHLAENRQVIQSLQPSAIALAVLARLQANGVSNIELLDQMLERGEDWLDGMMQRLDYCEQVQDFIQGDYTQWCYRSLEGAYDWIDTLLGSVKEGEEPRPPVEEDTEATEELLLQKLRVDDEEEMLESTLKQPAVTDEGESSAPEASDQEEIPLSVAEQFLMAGSTTEEQSEEGAVAEQPPELANWKDLEAPEERSVPWYSVNLAADASTESTQPEEMNEWIEVLEVENASKGGMNGAEVAVDNASAQDESEAPTEQAESGKQTLRAEPAEVAQASESSLSIGEADVAEEEAPVIEDASSATEPAIVPEEIPDEQSPDETEEAEEDLPAESETVEGEAVAASTSSQEDHGGGEFIRPADEGEVTPALVESGSAVDETPRNMEEEAGVEEAADFPSGDETGAEAAELHAVKHKEIFQNEPGDHQEIEAGQEFEIGKPGEEAETVIGEEANEAPGGDELSGEPETVPVQSEITSADPQEEAPASAEEERPWYEYLDLNEPVAQEQSRVEARVEPGRFDPIEVAGSAANSEIYETAEKNATEESQPESAIQEAIEREPEGSAGERTASEVPEDDATQPMVLRDIQRADLSETAHAASGEAEGIQLVASEIASFKVGEVAVSAEPGQGVRGPDEVRETISFATREAAGLPEAMKEQALHESSTQEKREAVSQPARQAPPQPQPEEPPRKRGFWQRLFTWLRGR